MSAGPGQSAPRPALYRDLRDLAPFRTPVIRTPVRGLAEGVGGAVSGVLAGRPRGALPVEGGAPRLGKVGGRTPGKAARESVGQKRRMDRNDLKFQRVARRSKDFAGEPCRN